MQLNQAADYAFRVVLHLSRLPPGRGVSFASPATDEKHEHGGIGK
ncbi:MAG TPA: hypothetical protein PKA28_12675 [Methylomusa anaerophila]|nr:Rrf2 family transcriptional regulator [Methylomusa anaerophila]HML89286.1 hypothetical protein [Methylomusa anaerophila]